MYIYIYVYTWQIYYGNYSTADILWQICYGRYIAGDISRQISYGSYITADTLRHIYKGRTVMTSLDLLIIEVFEPISRCHPVPYFSCHELMVRLPCIFINIYIHIFISKYA